MAPERFAVLRQAHALSQRALADALGVTPTYISLLESGKKHPSAALLTKIATYFRVEEDVLFLPPGRDTAPCARRTA